VFRTNEGPVRISIRPESVNVVDSKTRDRWVLETAEMTLQRIERLQHESEEARMVRDNYKTDASFYAGLVRETLQALKKEHET